MSIVDVTRESWSAGQLLAWGRTVIDPALRAAVCLLPEGPRHIVEYHFGWRDEHGDPIRGAAGKAVRPTLVLLTAEASGGTAEIALPAAVAVELVHNFSLLHDDVMDEDSTRHHRPCAWRVFGQGPAIVAGDALLALAFQVLSEQGQDNALPAIRILNGAVQALAAGQHWDMVFQQPRLTSVGDWVSMAEGKTAALLEASCRLGALYGGSDSARTHNFAEFGRLLGVSFQIVDDILGIWGDPAVTGKPVHSDLRNRKKSLPVVAALGSGTPAARELDALYHVEEPFTGVELRRAVELVESAAGHTWCRQEADRYLAGALGSLDAAEPDIRSRARLAALAHLLIRRES